MKEEQQDPGPGSGKSNRPSLSITGWWALAVAACGTLALAAMSGPMLGRATGSEQEGPCPTQTTRLGGTCIDNVIGPRSNFSDAFQACHDDGKSLCALETLLLCDWLDTTEEEEGSAHVCQKARDKTALNGWFWTRSLKLNHNADDYQIDPRRRFVLVYGAAEGPGPEQEVDAIRSVDADALQPYLCCRPAR